MNILNVTQCRRTYGVFVIGVIAVSMLNGCGGSVTRPQLSLSPVATKVSPGGAVPLAASFINTVPSTLTYTITPITSTPLPKGTDIGAVVVNSQAPTQATYTAPAAVPQKNFQVKIQAFAQKGKLPSTVSLVAVNQSVSLTPTSATVSIGQRTVQFYAVVSGDPQNQVTWTILGSQSNAGGTIDPKTGLYTSHVADGTIKDGSKDVVQAQSIMDGTLVAAATVTVQAASSQQITIN